MSTEVITGNDLKTILNEVLPPTPSEYRKLLWTNTIGGATSYSISFDKSEYDDIEVEIERYGNTQMIKIPISSASGDIYALNDSYEVGRAYTLTSSGLTFSNGYYYPTYIDSTNKSYGANYCVPSRVYGIKYERVMPPQVEVADCVIEQGKSTSGYWKWRKWNSGFVEAWYNRLLTISSTNTSIAVPSEITINTSKYWTCIVSGTGDGFIADVHHAWVKGDGTEVYVSATSSGNYRVSLYITYET